MGLRHDDFTSLYRRFPIGKDKRVWLWKPHGYSSEPSTIRMGLRDYGLQPMLALLAFKQFKQAERRWMGNTKVDKQQRVRKEVESLDHCGGTPSLENNWMTRVLALDCVMIGLSLSRSEWGLHWLFTQRSRNYARRGKCPAVEQWIACDSAIPPGVTHRVSSSWDAAWRSIGRKS